MELKQLTPTEKQELAFTKKRKFLKVSSCILIMQRQFFLMMPT